MGEKESVSRRLGRRPWAVFLALVVATLAFIPLYYEPLLTSVGRFLSLEDELQPADAVLVSYATDRAGVRRAADLYFAGRVRVIVLSNAKVDMPGVAARNLSELFRAELLSMGVPDEAMVVIRAVPTSTQEETRAVQEAFASRGVRSAIVVTAAPRMRRTLLSLRHALGKDGVRLSASPAAPPDFDLDRWWQSRQGISTVLMNEYPRLVYYYLRGRL